MIERHRCAAASRDRDEDLAGTASTARRWLAVEQPGPWGVDALPQSRMAARTATALQELGRVHDLRVVLLRRHGRDVDDGHRTAFVANTDAGTETLWSVRFDDPAELLELDLGRLGVGEVPDGLPVTAPLYLACTHGAHDACCAEFGRTAAAALIEAAGDRAWECSHVGGDRFAANVVVLPHGVYHGRVTAAGAAELVARHDSRRTVLDTFRGRTRYPFVVQFAEAALRRHLDEDRLDAVWAAGPHHRDGHLRRVPLLVDGRRFEVDVAVDSAAPARLTCRAGIEHRAPAFALHAIRPR